MARQGIARAHHRNEPRRTVEPLADYGFFGPGSVTWKVWGHSTTPILGLQRAVVVEELDPALVAAVDATGANYARPRTRYDRTVRYFATVALADSETVLKAADVLVKVHARAIGTEPLSGNAYDANDPRSQLWILVTGWHSVLTMHEAYGGGPLTDEEDRQYWAECAIAAEMQTCDPADVPRSREEARAYFERMRPHLAVSEAAQRMMDHLLTAKVAMPELPLPLRPLAHMLSALLRAGTIATLPRWMRRLSGFDQPAAVDLAVRPVLKAGFALVEASPRLKLAIASALAPSLHPIAAPQILGIAPLSPEVLTPAQARARYGYPRPAEAHRELRARQWQRVLGEGKPPSDEGLVESEAHLGNLA
ncbi:oxygenase MpaB family protein [Lolliginicoccus suaedae]|uniref:oxygenase MpaB family protein n=1 Tax=Lolliginicoccus suaedae TaxID=2605429 RepID=UPI0011EFE64F|nr:oxygenase MpaB family protein [Lolliginicoccus suaedae]